MNSPLAVYVHIPFCPSKCGYCDFNSYAMSGEVVDRTVAAIKQDIVGSPFAGRPANTIFFGGGTPTFIAAEQLTDLLQAVMEVHPPIAGCEITSEANPGTVDQSKFAAMRQAGFNRISLGAQSFHSGDLMRLGRVHGATDVGMAVLAARKAGFENFNLDLIYGLPGQSPAAWRKNLELALALNPPHLSLYGLMIEANTRFASYDRRGMLDLPTEDAVVEMDEAAFDVLEHAGLHRYEISNFAKPGFESQHNLAYWRYEEYAAYGPGAVGCVEMAEGRVRWMNIRQPVSYCESIEAQDGKTYEREVLSDESQAIEAIMLGLRLQEGIDWKALGVTENAVADLQRRGWAEVLGERLVLTQAGRLLHSEAVLVASEGLWSPFGNCVPVPST